MAGVWDWPGARWWKCDLHVHTPGSDDAYREGPAPDATAWLQAAKDAGLQVVAVTDHNAADWVNKLPREAGLTIVPGVELTCASGVHLLVLFDPALSPDSARDEVLQDGPLSVRNDQAGTDDPNAVPDLAIEAVSIGHTAHLGNGKPFELRLNPWLNALIGGRGTGKSTPGRDPAPPPSRRTWAGSGSRARRGARRPRCRP